MRNRPFWFWAFVALAVGLPYPLSFGPACWLTSRWNIGARYIPKIYWPLAACLKNDTSIVTMPLLLYSRLGAADSWNWVRYLEANDDRGIKAGEIRWEMSPQRRIFRPVIVSNSPPDETPDSVPLTAPPGYGGTMPE